MRLARLHVVQEEKGETVCWLVSMLLRHPFTQVFEGKREHGPATCADKIHFKQRKIAFKMQNMAGGTDFTDPTGMR